MARKATKRAATKPKVTRFSTARRTKMDIEIHRDAQTGIVVAKARTPSVRRKPRRNAAQGGFLASPTLGNTLTKAFAVAVARARDAHG